MQIDVTERKEQRKVILGIRRSAWVEMAVAFGVLLVVDWIFFDFNRYWALVFSLPHR